MSKLLLAFVLLFVGGQKWVNSREIASMEFHDSFLIIIEDYVEGKCVNLESSLRNQATKVLIDVKNITMTLYDEMNCGGKKVNLNATIHGDLNKFGFKDVAKSYKIVKGNPPVDPEIDPSQHPASDLPDVTLYEKANYRGKEVNITFANESCSNVPDLYGASLSIKVTKPVMLCMNKGCDGQKLEVDNNMVSIKDPYTSAKSVMKLPIKQAAILYEKEDYWGDQYVITFPDGSACENLPNSFLNKASSVIVSRTLYLFTENDCKGEHIQVNSSLASLLTMKQKVASVWDAPPPPPGITLYEHKNHTGRIYEAYFTGDSTCINLPDDFQNITTSVKILYKTADVYMLCAEKDCKGTKMEALKNYTSIGDMNDKVMSVAQLPLLQPAILYEHINYEGRQFNVTFPRFDDCQNLPDHFQKIASSVVASEPVILYTKKNCKGEMMKVKTNVPHLKAIHDRVRSVKKEVPVAVLYKDAWFNGEKAYVTFPDSSCEKYPNYMLDAASSVLAYKHVTLWTQSDCGNKKYPINYSEFVLPIEDDGHAINDNLMSAQKN